MTRRLLTTASLVLMLALVLGACGQPAPPEPPPPAPTEATAPTESPAPTAAATAVPTAAPTAVPTATPAPDAGAIVREAITNTLAATAMQFDMEAAMQPAGAAVESPELYINARLSGTDAEVRLTGKAIETGFQAPELNGAQVGSQMYVRGPATHPATRLEDGRWYTAEGNGGFTQADAAAMIERALPAGVVAALTKSADQQLDGRACQVFSAGAEASAMALAGLRATPLTLYGVETGPASYAPYRDAQLKVWACDDGYLHQLELSGTGYIDGAGLTEPAPLRHKLRMSAFDEAKPITAPADATAFDPSAPATAAASTLTASVFNGGNVRAEPGPQSQVLDQINAAESVTLLAKNDNGAWYKITNARGITGWVSASLLTVDPQVAAQVPSGAQAAAATAPITSAPAQSGGAIPAAAFENSPIGKALLKTSTVKSFQFELEIAGSGLEGELPGLPISGGMVTLITASGKVQPPNAQIAVKGVLLSMMGGNPAQGLEFITMGDKLYLHGPLPMLGANEARWYVMEGQQSGSLTPDGSNNDQALEDLRRQGNAFAQIPKLRSEALDGRQCDVYGAEGAQALALLGGLESSGMSADDLSQLESASFGIWVCDDGYFHKLELSAAGRSKTSAKNQSIRLMLHLFDFNGQFAITPPADAQPLQPSFGPSLSL